MIGQLQEIISESGEEGQFELGNMRIEIKSIQLVNIPIKPLFSTT
jgi:hypothetical protein